MTWFSLFFPTLTRPADVNDPAWRSALGAWLKKHLLFVNLVKLLKGQIVSLAELQQQMQGPLPEGARAHIHRAGCLLLVLVAWARDPVGRPLVTLKVQLWMRELRRMVTQVRGDTLKIELRAESDIKREPGKLYLPLLQCADCTPRVGSADCPTASHDWPPIWMGPTPGSPGNRKPCVFMPFPD